MPSTRRDYSEFLIKNSDSKPAMMNVRNYQIRELHGAMDEASLILKAGRPPSLPLAFPAIGLLLPFSVACSLLGGVAYTVW